MSKVAMTITVNGQPQHITCSSSAGMITAYTTLNETSAPELVLIADGREQRFGPLSDRVAVDRIIAKKFGGQRLPSLNLSRRALWNLVVVVGVGLAGFSAGNLWPNEDKAYQVSAEKSDKALMELAVQMAAENEAKRRNHAEVPQLQQPQARVEQSQASEPEHSSASAPATAWKR